ncbi:MAG: hypothetical protein ACK4YF_01135 [Exilispira sp.]
MKKIIKDAILTLKYLLISFIISFILTIIFYIALSSNEIQRYHYLYSNFIVFYYLILKINIVIYALLPISLMITAFISFSYTASRESSSIGAAIGLLIFCLIIFGSLYISLFQDSNRVKTISKLYQPKINETIPFIYEKGIMTFQEYQFYFENKKAYYFENNNFFISDIKIDLKKNLITILKLNNGIGKDFKYIDEIGQIDSLSFLNPLIKNINKNFEELVYFLSNSKGIFFIIYLFSFFFVICWIPFIIHNDNFPFPYFIFSAILILLTSFLFLATFKFSIDYLKDLRLQKIYIYLFPVMIFSIIFLFEALLIYIKYSRKIFHTKIQQAKKAQIGKRGK